MSLGSKGLILIALGAQSARAQTPPAEPEPSELELFQLDTELKQQTKVASAKARTINEAPGIVTVLNREEILASGARDLIDVLMLVPGFSFGVDVEGVTDVGFRGIWAHEGKIALLVDGQEMNELLFQNNELGHHYPIDMIERVEIVRGPGSVLYGGEAELGVINIVTRNAKDLSGAHASVYYGQMAHVLGQADLNLAVGKQSVAGISDLNVSFAGFIGIGQRSAATYTDFSGNSYSMVGNSGLNPLFLNLGIQYKDLKLRFLFDNYTIHEVDSSGSVDTTGTQPLAAEHFTMFLADATYDWHILGKWLTLTPRFQFKRELPWNVTDPNSRDYLDATLQRITASLTASSDPLDTLHLMLGLQFFLDRGWDNSIDYVGVGYQQLFNGQSYETFTDVAAFGEAQYDSIIGSLTVGARFEHQSAAGDSFVPRAALTKTIDKFHFKLLWQYAFRAPGFGDTIESPAGQVVVPENTRDTEIEVGYRPTDHVALTVNVFDITVHNPIVYLGAANEYENVPQTGSQGLEAEVRVTYPLWQLRANYSFYTDYNLFTGAVKNVGLPASDSLPAYNPYLVPGQPALLLGMPAHKLAFNGRVNVWRNLTINSSGVFLSERYGYLTGDSSGNPVLGASPPLFLFNLFVTYKNAFVDNLELGAGVYDLFDARYAFIQPYASGHAPLPGPSREFVARLSYALPF